MFIRPGLLLVLLVVVLIFGGKRIPEIFKAIGQSTKNFKKAFRGDDKDPPTKVN